MKKLRVYVDTSVLGGCLTRIRQMVNGLMDDFPGGRFRAVLSDVTPLSLHRLRTGAVHAS
jgi:hypothetical protein